MVKRPAPLQIICRWWVNYVTEPGGWEKGTTQVGAGPDGPARPLVPLALRTWPRPSGPHSSLDFTNQSGRRKTVQNALRRVVRNIEPRLQGIHRQGNARILQHAVDDALHECRPVSDVAPFVPHGSPSLRLHRRQVKCRKKRQGSETVNGRAARLSVRHSRLAVGQ